VNAIERFPTGGPMNDVALFQIRDVDGWAFVVNGIVLLAVCAVWALWHRRRAR